LNIAASRSEHASFGPHSIFITALLLLAVGTAGGAYAASFDCTLASSRVDKLICASPQVSKLDSELDAAYKAALSTSTSPEGVKTAQRAWLKETRNPCADEACFVTAYQQRVLALRSAASTAQANAEADADAEDQAIAKADAEEKVRAEAETQKAAEQAAIAASAAQAQKLAEQAKAKELEEKATADTRRSAEQKQLFTIIAGILAIGFFAFGSWLWFRKKSRAKPSVKESTPSAGATDGSVLTSSPTGATKATDPEVLSQTALAESLAVDNEPKTTARKAPSSVAWGWLKRHPVISIVVLLIAIGAFSGEASKTFSGPSFSSLPPEQQVKACELFSNIAVGVLDEYDTGGSSAKWRARYKSDISNQPEAAQSFVNLMLDKVEQDNVNGVKSLKFMGPQRLTKALFASCLGSAKPSDTKSADTSSAGQQDSGPIAELNSKFFSMGPRCPATVKSTAMTNMAKIRELQGIPYPAQQEAARNLASQTIAYLAGFGCISR
jgi:uncharacterized protein